MRTRTLVAVTLALVAVLAWNGAAAAQSTLDTVKKRGTLVAGVKADYPPFGYTDKDGKLVGFDIDVVQYLAKSGMTMIVVTHEMGFARRVADRVLFMDAGAVVEASPPDAFFDHPQSPRTKSFLGKILVH